MFTENQLQQLTQLKEKWLLWKNTQVNTFTREERQVIANIRATLGWPELNLGCNICFKEEMEKVMTAYEKQMQSSDTTQQNEAGE